MKNLKKEYEDLKEKLQELSEDELVQLTGGTIDPKDNDGL